MQGNSYYDNLGDTAGALRSYQRSLAIRQQLVARHPANLGLQSELADSYSGVGDMLFAVNDLAGGLRHYDQARQLRQTLLAADPNNVKYRRALAQTYGGIGDIKGMEGNANLGDTAGALESYRQALKLCEELFAAAPENPEVHFSLAKALMQFGYTAGSAGDTRAAVESGRRSVSLFEALVAAHPNQTDYTNQLGSSYACLRQALADSGLMNEAVATDRKNVRMDEAMIAADPRNTLLRRGLSVDLTTLGLDLKTTGQAAEAIPHLRQALKIIQALADADPQSAEHRHDVAFTCLRLGEAHHAARDFSAALVAFRQAAAIKEARIKAASDSAEAPNPRDQDNLATINAGIGKTLAATGDTSGALTALQQAVRLAEAATAQSPDHAKGKARYALRRLELARLHARLGATAAACAEFAQSLKLWEQLRDGGKLIPIDAGKPDEVARELIACR